MSYPENHTENDTTSLPTLVVGAGPIGLAAAAHLLERGLDPLVVERGPHAAAAVRGWGHVRLFSRWAELIDPAAARLLAPTGWTAPDDNGYPTGEQWATLYLQPLADALGDRVVYDTTVTGLARRGRDRVVDTGRDGQPFTAHLRGADGAEYRIQARAVVDASGTFATPNPLGADGYPAAGERAATSRIAYRVPNVDDPADARPVRRPADRGRGIRSLRPDRPRRPGHAGRDRAEHHRGLGAAPRGRRRRVRRRGRRPAARPRSTRKPGPGGRRSRLHRGGHRLPHRRRRTNERREGRLPQGDATLSLISADGRRISGIDQVVGLTGFRPDHSVTAELRLNLDTRLEAPVKLAPLIDPNVHSCGTVYPHGADVLSHDEQGVYLVGMKSYGRAPTFLAMTGYEQVRSVSAALAGDHEAASRVELTLPETGVCGGSGLFDADASDGQTTSGGCCTPTPTLLQIGASAGSASC